jgi:hypothetical protein
MQEFRKDQRGRNETEQLLFGSIAERSIQLFQWRQLVKKSLGVQARHAE